MWSWISTVNSLTFLFPQVGNYSSECLGIIINMIFRSNISLKSLIVTCGQHGYVNEDFYMHVYEWQMWFVQEFSIGICKENL